jgi:ribose transport system substrate-binding protein
MKRGILLAAIIGVLSLSIFFVYRLYQKHSAEGGTPMFAFVVDIPGRFWEIAYAGCLKAGQEENVAVEYHAPGQSSPAQQQQIVESLVARGCRGIAICPLNPESISRLLDKASEYMPVICQGSDAPHSKRIAYIGADNFSAGRIAGEQLKKAMPEGGQVAIFSATMDIANQRERSDGVIAALKGSNCEVVGVFTDQADRARAQANVRTILAKYPDLKGIVGVAGYNAPAAVMALRDYSNHKIKVVGFDEDVETFEAVRRGDIYASVAQQPFEFGYQSIKMLAKINRGQKVELPENKIIFVPVYIINKDNVNAVEKDVEQKLSALSMKVKHF